MRMRLGGNFRGISWQEFEMILVAFVAAYSFLTIQRISKVS